MYHLINVNGVGLMKDRIGKWYMSFNNPGNPAIIYVYDKTSIFWVNNVKC